MYCPFNKLNPSPFDGAVRLHFNTKNAKLIHTHTAAFSLPAGYTCPGADKCLAWFDLKELNTSRALGTFGTSNPKPGPLSGSLKCLALVLALGRAQASRSAPCAAEGLGSVFPISRLKLQFRQQRRGRSLTGYWRFRLNSGRRFGCMANHQSPITNHGKSPGIDW